MPNEDQFVDQTRCGPGVEQVQTRYRSQCTPSKDQADFLLGPTKAADHRHHHHHHLWSSSSPASKLTCIYALDYSNVLELATHVYDVLLPTPTQPCTRRRRRATFRNDANLDGETGVDLTCHMQLAFNVAPAVTKTCVYVHAPFVFVKLVTTQTCVSIPCCNQFKFVCFKTTMWVHRCSTLLYIISFHTERARLYMLPITIIEIMKSFFWKLAWMSNSLNAFEISIQVCYKTQPYEKDDHEGDILA